MIGGYERAQAEYEEREDPKLVKDHQCDACGMYVPGGCMASVVSCGAEGDFCCKCRNDVTCDEHDEDREPDADEFNHDEARDV